MLRTLIFYILFIPLTLLFSLIAVLGGLIGQQWLASRVGGQWWGAAAAWLTGLPIQADLSRLPKEGPCVFMATHQSLMDIPILYSVLRDFPIAFVAKKSLFDIPVFGAAMRAAGHIPIDRSNRRAGMKSIEQAAQAAQAGTCPVIFPEGTRNRELDQLLDFKIGGMVLALKCDLPVVPVVMDGTGEAFPKGSLFMRRRPIRIRVLAPAAPGDYTLKQREQFKDDLYQRMNETYQELRRGN
ncbi:MAG: lysophospholipid acyltransferase family protein [Desulfovibrionaceae bacterium]